MDDKPPPYDDLDAESARYFLLLRARERRPTHEAVQHSGISSTRASTSITSAEETMQDHGEVRSADSTPVGPQQARTPCPVASRESGAGSGHEDATERIKEFASAPSAAGRSVSAWLKGVRPQDGAEEPVLSSPGAGQSVSQITGTTAGPSKPTQQAVLGRRLQRAAVRAKLGARNESLKALRAEKAGQSGRLETPRAAAQVAAGGDEVQGSASVDLRDLAAPEAVVEIRDQIKDEEFEEVDMGHDGAEVEVEDGWVMLGRNVAVGDL